MTSAARLAVVAVAVDVRADRALAQAVVDSVVGQDGRGVCRRAAQHRVAAVARGGLLERVAAGPALHLVVPRPAAEAGEQARRPHEVVVARAAEQLGRARLDAGRGKSVVPAAQAGVEHEVEELVTDRAARLDGRNRLAAVTGVERHAVGDGDDGPLPGDRHVVVLAALSAQVQAVRDPRGLVVDRLDLHGRGGRGIGTHRQDRCQHDENPQR
jgi:hypothetical protein